MRSHTLFGNKEEVKMKNVQDGESTCSPGMEMTICITLGPGRPSAGGPRMDRRAVTCLGVVKISRLALRLWRSAPRGPDPTAVLIKLLLLTACQEGVSQNCH